MSAFPLEHVTIDITLPYIMQSPMAPAPSYTDEKLHFILQCEDVYQFQFREDTGRTTLPVGCLLLRILISSSWISVITFILLYTRTIIAHLFYELLPLTSEYLTIFWFTNM